MQTPDDASRGRAPRWTRLALAAGALGVAALARIYVHPATTNSYLQACFEDQAPRRAILYETQFRSGAKGGRTATHHWLKDCGLHFSPPKQTKERAAAAALGLRKLDDQSAIANGVGYINVDTRKRFQEIDGFGGAFTEASANVWMKLPPKQRKKVIDLYFSEEGAGYTLGRVHMNSCDFCTSSYDFAPVDGDYDLEHFDSEVKHDQATMIPLMQAAKKAVEKRGEAFKLFASPWSPPAWLKAPNSVPPMRPTITFDQNRSMLGSAQPLGLQNDPRAFESWALYYAKFAAAYAAQNLTLWGFTVQNEPEFSAPFAAASFLMGPLRHRSPTTGAFQKDHRGAVVRLRSPSTRAGGRPAAGTRRRRRPSSATTWGRGSRRTTRPYYCSSSTTTGTTSWSGAGTSTRTQRRPSTSMDWPSIGTRAASSAT